MRAFYPVGFTERPLLETIGWAPRLDLAGLIHRNVWGEREGMDDLVGHLREGGMLK